MATHRNHKNGETPVPKKEVRHRQQYPVSAEKFVLTWNSCDTADEAAKKLKMPKDIVLARVSLYRKKGINLKKMRRHDSRRLDIDRLNKMIAKHSKSELPLTSVAVPADILEKIAHDAAQKAVEETIRLAAEG